MSSATIYQLKNKLFLFHADIKTVSGFRVAAEPFIKISVEASNDILVDAIKLSLSNDDSLRLPNPKDWKEFNKEFLQKMEINSLSDLEKPTTLCCGLRNDGDKFVYTPTKHAEKPDKGFTHNSKEEIAVYYTASKEEIVKALKLAFSRCE